jgi:glycosyltransferase involved in cell wall biosynthesis
LRIWIVQAGEQLPTDRGPPRLLRAAILARHLASRGHSVTMFVSTFNHQQKYHRVGQTASLGFMDGYEVIALRGRAYSKNVSAARIWSQREQAHEFRRIAPSLPRPDVIHCGYPTIELADVTTTYGRELEIPVIVDCRDQWPDIFASYLQSGLRPFCVPLVTYWKGKRNKVMRKAHCISGVTDHFVNWGLEAAGRVRTEQDRAFPLAIDTEEPSPAQLLQAEDFWIQKLRGLESGRTIIVFSGTVSVQMDQITVMEASKALSETQRNKLLLVMCARGDAYEDMEHSARNHRHILMAGWRNAAEMKVILSKAKVGLLPYANTPDRLINVPNKVGEYLAHGVPVMTCLKGVTGQLLETQGVGIPYTFGSLESSKNALIDLVSGRYDFDKMSMAARELYYRLFDANKVYKDLCEYVEGVASGK